MTRLARHNKTKQIKALKQKWYAKGYRRRNGIWYKAVGRWKVTIEQGKSLQMPKGAEVTPVTGLPDGIVGFAYVETNK